MLTLFKEEKGSLAGQSWWVRQTVAGIACIYFINCYRPSQTQRQERQEGEGEILKIPGTPSPTAMLKVPWTPTQQF